VNSGKVMNQSKARYEWNTIRWRKPEVVVFKPRKRIYRASQSKGGVHDKRPTVEEPYELKGSRTVLKSSKEGRPFLLR